MKTLLIPKNSAHSLPENVCHDACRSGDGIEGREAVWGEVAHVSTSCILQRPLDVVPRSTVGPLGQAYVNDNEDDAHNSIQGLDFNSDKNIPKLFKSGKHFWRL